MMRDFLEIRLEKKIRNKGLMAITGEIAWRPEDIDRAIDDIENHGWAINGITLWSVYMNSANDMPSSISILNLNVTDIEELALLDGRGPHHIGAVIHPEDNQSWDDYRQYSIDQARDYIAKTLPRAQASPGAALHISPVILDRDAFNDIYCP